jgi:hypothetical protein
VDLVLFRALETTSLQALGPRRSTRQTRAWHQPGSITNPHGRGPQAASNSMCCPDWQVAFSAGTARLRIFPRPQQCPVGGVSHSGLCGCAAMNPAASFEHRATLRLNTGGCPPPQRGPLAMPPRTLQLAWEQNLAALSIRSLIACRRHSPSAAPFSTSSVRAATACLIRQA